MVFVSKRSFLDEGIKTMFISGYKGKSLYIVVRDYADLVN